MKTITLSGDLDIFRRSETQLALSGIVDERFAVIDLRNVRMLDAAFLGQLVASSKTALRSGGEVILVAPNPTVRRILRLVHFDELFRIVEKPVTRTCDRGRE